MRGLAALPYELTADQILDLETRNPSAGTIIENYSIYGSWGVPVNLSTGYSFMDDVYGNVIISTDAQGNLHIIGSSPVSPGVVNQPVYTSPPIIPGTCTHEVLGVCLDAAYDLVKTIAVVAGVYLVYRMVSK